MTWWRIEPCCGSSFTQEEKITALDLLRQLPDRETLKSISRSLATLDLIMSPSWEGRYYSYDSAWGEHEEFASMRNGQGDEYSIVFGPGGVYVRGFSHESPMAPAKLSGSLWPGVVDSVPEIFREYVEEPSFGGSDGPLVTVCLWWLDEQDAAWHCGDIDFPDVEDPDGSDFLFSLVIDQSPENYLKFARSYYGVELDLSIVHAIYNMQPLTPEIISTLNPEIGLTDIMEDLEEIGYPVEKL
ncbi:hypothetical protein [Streptomyces sp. NPDC056663]|uniref:hypothetical protein n=1 Tax=Streptomyces sp. NPDC056663 TaxID=3345899 RepID=UPI0036BA4212